MKRKLLLLFQPACICVLIACTIQDREEWESEVAGIYTTQYEQPYSIGFDTVFITKMKNASGSFYVQRNTGYQRKGGTGSKFFKTEKWIGVADRSQRLLQIMPSGRELWFNTTTNEITIGTTTYHRL